MNKGTEQERFLGSNFSSVQLQPGDSFTRPSAGGGGYGDPLERPLAEVREDVIDGYVSVERAAKDYGVVITVVDKDLDDYAIDEIASKALREEIRARRRGWLTTDPQDVASRYRLGEVSLLDVIRSYGVILDWGTGELYPTTTSQYRELMQRRSAAYWR